MKKIVLTYGLISGAIMSGLMLLTVAFVDRIGFDRGVIVGYTTMVLAFLMVFFGIRSYRENVGGGEISFGRAFTVGILIMLITCVIYVLTWQFEYRAFFPDFMDRYAAHVIEKARASGASPEELTRQREELNGFKEMYANPMYNVAFTILEPLPVGIVMTLISAAILRKRRRPEPA
jgi:hypothetical protein